MTIVFDVVDEGLESGSPTLWALGRSLPLRLLLNPSLDVLDVVTFSDESMKCLRGATAPGHAFVGPFF